MTERAAWLERTLRDALQPAHLEVEDESEQHRGHAGARGGGSHFRVVIVSDRFAGLAPVARQRAVYAALGAAMGKEIHALAMTVLTPEEWERQGPR